MSSQAVRNLINNQIDSLIMQAETMARSEGKKKLAELKEKIPTPEELVEKLKAEIGKDSCSEEGIEKFLKKFDTRDGKLESIETTVDKGIKTLDGMIEKLDPVIGGSGPLGKIEGFIEKISPIIDALKYVISLAPILLAANSGPTSSGLVTDQVSDKKNMAKVKVLEYVALFAAIPAMILMYTSKLQLFLIR